MGITSSHLFIMSSSVSSARILITINKRRNRLKRRYCWGFTVTVRLKCAIWHDPSSTLEAEFSGDGDDDDDDGEGCKIAKSWDGRTRMKDQAHRSGCTLNLMHISWILTTPRIIKSTRTSHGLQPSESTPNQWLLMRQSVRGSRAITHRHRNIHHTMMNATTGPTLITF